MTLSRPTKNPQLDYHPGGSLMPGRSYEGGSDYRYGFQGQETDDEMLGGAVSFKYRVHDPRINRFLSTDPLAPDYPWNSPYAFSENSLIAFFELEGLEKVPVNPNTHSLPIQEAADFQGRKGVDFFPVTTVDWQDVQDKVTTFFFVPDVSALNGKRGDVWVQLGGWDTKTVTREIPGRDPVIDKVWQPGGKSSNSSSGRSAYSENHPTKGYLNPPQNEVRNVLDAALRQAQSNLEGGDIQSVSISVSLGPEVYFNSTVDPVIR